VRCTQWEGEEITVNALHYATMYRNEDVVRTLLKLGLADEATAPYPRFTWRCENYSYTTHAQTRADNGHTQEMCPHVAVVRFATTHTRHTTRTTRTVAAR
jgi:hypothetical protein